MAAPEVRAAPHAGGAIAAVAVALLSAAAACANPEAGLPRAVLDAWLEQDRASSERLVERIDAIEAGGTVLPPGVGAGRVFHLAALGRADAARAALDTERARYPELSAFFDALQRHLDGTR